MLSKKSVSFFCWYFFSSHTKPSLNHIKRRIRFTIHHIILCFHSRSHAESIEISFHTKGIDSSCHSIASIISTAQAWYFHLFSINCDALSKYHHSFSIFSINSSVILGFIEFSNSCIFWFCCSDNAEFHFVSSV